MDIEQLAGTKLGNYEIESLLGRGGMGVVYKACQISLDRPVALKILPPTFSSDPSFVKRFQREARAVAKLSHQNIVQIFDITEEKGLHFFSMEYIEGRTLDDLLKEKGRIDADEAVSVISQVARALKHAHENKILHRDIKPSNILLDRRGNAKVMDFGLARIADERSKLTQSGTLVGTVDYMSPEQAQGESADHRTDIWSLGVVMYEMLAGTTPFDAPSDAALLHKIIYDDPSDVRNLNPAVPSGLSAVVSRAMAKKKEDRYASIPEFLTDIRAFKTLDAVEHVLGKKRRDTRPMGIAAIEDKVMPFFAKRTPFVGREGEQADLRWFLDRAKSGNGALVMLGGEPGVGKTRITEELAAEAERQGFLSLTGHCYEMEGAPPYIPFIEILQSTIRLVNPDTLLENLGDAAPEAAKLVPGLRERFPDIPEPRKLPPEQERLYLFNKLCGFFERLANQRPLLLIIEDLHWTDEPTLLLLQHTVQRLQEMSVLIVGTYRDTELDVARSLAKALEELLRRRLAHDMILKRLSEADVSAMLRGRSEEEPPSRLVGVIFQETEGNPFFVEEVFKHLAEEEKLFDAEGKWRSDIRIEGTDVPRGVLLVIGHRLERVSEQCRRILARAAVIGRGVSFKLLNQMIELDEDALFDAIEEAERAQLILTVTRRGEDHITFAHELIRQTLLSDFSTPRRRRLHLHIAEAMERIYAGALEEHSADLAHHFYQAGSDTEKIIKYAVMAAERATAQTAYEAAVAQYQRALQAPDIQQTIDELRRCDLFLALGHAYGNAGDPQRGEEAFFQVIEIARKVPAPEQFAEAVLGLWRFRIMLAVADQEAIGLLEEGLGLLPEEDSALRASLLGHLSELLTNAGIQENRAVLSEQAVAMARRVGDAKALVYALRSRALLMERPLADRIADAAELAELERELGRPQGADWGLIFLCHHHTEQGDVAAVDVCLAKLKEVAAELSHPTTIWRSKVIEAMRALMTGKFDEADRLAVEAFGVGQKVAEENAGQYLIGAMLILRWLQGRLAELEDMWGSASEPYAEVPLYCSINAWFHLMLGREDKARKEFERLAEHDFAKLPQDFMSTYFILMLLSEVAVAISDTRRAALLYDLLRPHADYLLMEGLLCVCHGATTLWLGLLARTLRRWDDAVAHFEDALETNARIGARPYLARTQHEYAQMLIERNAPGDRDKARTLLTEATATYRELGMPSYLEMAESLLGTL